MRQNTLAQALTVTIVVLGFLNGCRKPQPKKPQGPKTVHITASALRTSAIESELETIGNVTSETVTDVLAPEEGRITSLPFAEGDRVVEGEIIASISGKEREALVSSATADLLAAKRKLQSVALDGEGREKLEKEAAQAQRELDFAVRQYRETPVTAPITGTIIKRFIVRGAMVTAKEPLMRLADMNRLLIRCDIPELRSSNLHVGQRAVVRVDARPGEVFQAKVTRVYPYVEENNRATPVELTIEKTGAKLRIGMFCRVSLILERKNDALVVPHDALITTPSGEKAIFVTDGRTASRRIVRTGIVSGSRVEVVDGLHAGELIVVEGQHALKDGTKVALRGDAAGASKKR